MRDAILGLWPEIDWIADHDLKATARKAGERAPELSPMTVEDLEQIPITLLAPGRRVGFIAHKRCVVHIGRRAADLLSLLNEG